MNAILIRRIAAAAALVLAVIALLAAVASGFTAPAWVLPAAVAAIAVTLFL